LNLRFQNDRLEIPTLSNQSVTSKHCQSELVSDSSVFEIHSTEFFNRINFVESPILERQAFSF